MAIVGLDLSLTATGVARITGVGKVTTATVRSKGKAGDSLRERARRLRELRDSIAAFVGPFDTVVIEQPAFASTGGSHHDRSGLWWLVVEKLASFETPTVEVPPTVLKKYVTGKGNASKMEVMARIIRLLPDVEISNDNEADAVGLALMGSRAAFMPLEPVLAKANLEAMEKVRWT